MDERV